MTRNSSNDALTHLPAVASESLSRAVLTLLAAMAAHGYWLLNFSLPIDGEYENNFIQTIAFGRWGHALLKQWVLPEPFIPFFTPLLSVVFICCAALLTAHLCRLRGAPAYVFCVVFVSFPQLAYQFEFINQADTVALGYLGAAGAVWLYLSAQRQTSVMRVGGFILSAVLYGYVMAIYQTMALLPPLILLGVLVIRHHEAEFASTREVLTQIGGFIIVAVCATALYLVAANILQNMYRDQFPSHVAEYLANFTRGNVYNLGYFVDVAGHIGRGLLGRTNFGLATYAVVLLSGATAVMCTLARGRSWNSALRAALIAAIVLFPFSLSITSQYPLPPRVFVAMNVAAAIVLAYAAQAINPRVALAAAVCLLGLHSAATSQLFYSDTQARTADILKANRIKTVIRLNYPEFDASNTPVYFHGGSPNDNPHKLPNSDVFGSTFFSWDGGNNTRLSRFFTYYDIMRVRMADQNETKRVLPHVDELPTWPHPDAVAMIEGVMVIKLGQQRGWLPFSVD